MKYSHNEKSPVIDPSAYIAPSAIISGDVTIGAKCAVLHGAIITSEGAPIVLGSECVVMEHAVIRASGGAVLSFATSIGQRCIVGPHAYIVGATIGDGCYIASGARVCNDAQLPAQTTVPMQHIAYGSPAIVVGPEKAQTVLQATTLFETVFNESSSPDAAGKAAATYASFLRKAHAKDATALEPTATRSTKPVARRSVTEEPPPRQSADVDGVVDAMMLELMEMEQRRKESQKKPKRTP